MDASRVVLSTVAFLLFAIAASAESHTVHFNNYCGYGTPRLVRGLTILSRGEDYTSRGPLASAIAYLQTGDCLFNGENCAIVELTLNNPKCIGCGSSVDISLITPHAFNVPIGFSFQNGCDGYGATCTSPDCRTAFFQSDDNHVQVSCQENDVDLLVTFCDGSSPRGKGNTAVSSRPVLAILNSTGDVSNGNHFVDPSPSSSSSPGLVPPSPIAAAKVPTPPSSQRRPSRRGSKKRNILQPQRRL